MKFRIAKRYPFNSVHTVPGEVDEQGRPLVHGHNYAVTFVLEADRLTEAQWVYSRDRLDQEIATRILPFVHQKNLDLWIEPATGEKICEKFAEELRQSDLGKLLIEIRLEETRKNTFNLQIHTGLPATSN